MQNAISNVPSLENTFIEQVGSSFRIIADGIGRYRISVPFTFHDGDVLVIVLKQAGDHWVLSDEGHTYMHLAYTIEEPCFQYGTRQKIIEQALRMFQVEDRSGELVLPIEYNDDCLACNYADALWSFVQALLKIIG